MPDFEHLLRQAEAGDAQAQCQLAILLEEDENSPTEAGGHDAPYWRLQAAQQGHAEAQYDLACALDAESDDEAPMTAGGHDASYWRLQAAQQGHAEAQYDLACALDASGKENASAGGHDALHWLLQAAQQGHAEAQYDLACALDASGKENASAGGHDALHWFLQAAQQGVGGAQYHIACALESGEINTEEADGHDALYWFLQAARQGCMEALFKLAESYNENDLKAAGGDELAGLCQQCRKMNHLSGSGLFLGLSAISGPSLQPDSFQPEIQEAPLANEEDPILAQADEAMGKGDIDRAIRLLQQAGEKGNAKALESLATCYLQGHGCARDLQRATSYYERAAELGSIQARYELACIRLGGEGSAPDFDKAAELLIPLAKENYLDSAQLLQQAQNREALKPFRYNGRRTIYSGREILFLYLTALLLTLLALTAIHFLKTILP